MNDTNTLGHYVYSALGGDPDLQDIVEMFAKELPKRADAILGHLNRKDWESLQRTAHQLKGAAGSYGFLPISPFAGCIEAAVRNGEPEEVIRKTVEELVDLCSRARCGRPPVA
jgi:HPt (histidine-containing phosphotransfer) domain-containing protein